MHNAQHATFIKNVLFSTSIGSANAREIIRFPIVILIHPTSTKFKILPFYFSGKCLSFSCIQTLVKSELGVEIVVSCFVNASIFSLISCRCGALCGFCISRRLLGSTRQSDSCIFLPYQAISFDNHVHSTFYTAFETNRKNCQSSID